MSTTSKEREVPSVIIVGAGLGGLMLAILFERMGVDYIILERSSQFKSLGKPSTTLVDQERHCDPVYSIRY